MNLAIRKREIAALTAKVAELEAALDNSQSLLVMIVALGDGRSALGFQHPSGITDPEWKTEGLTKLLDEQVAENHAALDNADGGRGS